MPDAYTATLTLPFDVPGVFWRDSVTATVSSPAQITWTGDPNELAGTTGTITDPVFLLDGSLAAAVTITDEATSKSLRWIGNVPTASRLRIDVATLSAFAVPTATGDGWTGGTEVSGGLSVGPGGFDLNPNAAGRVRWFLDRGPGPAGINALRARRTYL